MLAIRLDGSGPLHRQVYRALRDLILAGRLPAEARLASSRDLAVELGVSRNTVLAAYDQLLAEGYVVARAGAGTFVASVPARRVGSRRGVEAPLRGDESTARRSAEPARLSAVAERLLSSVPLRQASWSLPREPVRVDFRYGEPAYAELPLATWARILGRRARRVSVRRLAYQEPGGAAELREALAGYLSRARGVVCSAESIVVTRGSQQAIDLVTRLLVDAGSRVVVEEPHYTGFTFCLRALGADVVFVPVDGQGLCVDHLAGVGKTRLVFVTPSHQFPAGGVLTLPRRIALLEWARDREAYVFEDDYDGEFRFAGRPVESLQALDRDGRVLYGGTASKLLFPALRVGWLVAPEPLVGPVRALQALSDTGTASLEQLALADFITEGHLERHVRRVRARHAARRHVLLDALARELDARAETFGEDAGVHVLVRLPELAGRDVSRLRVACREHGVGVYPAAPFYDSPPARAELLLGYGGLSESAIRDGVRRLRQALDAVSGAR